jgi:hypothetical protein
VRGGDENWVTSCGFYVFNAPSAVRTYRDVLVKAELNHPFDSALPSAKILHLA